MIMLKHHHAQETRSALNLVPNNSEYQQIIVKLEHLFRFFTIGQCDAFLSEYLTDLKLHRANKFQQAPLGAIFDEIYFVLCNIR